MPPTRFLAPSTSRRPYTTLFRSEEVAGDPGEGAEGKDLEPTRQPVSMRPATLERTHRKQHRARQNDRHPQRGGHVKEQDRKSTRLNSSHRCISYAVFCVKKKKNK